MSAKFFLQDVVQEFGRKLGKRVVPDVLFFSLQRSGPGGGAPGTDIVVKAEMDHALRYSAALEAFLKEHPKYVLPWPELMPKEVVAPAAPAPVVEEPKAKKEKAKKEE